MKQFAKEKLQHWLRVLLHTKDSPERTSFAFALGVFVAFLPPIPWFHTIFALLLAFMFRLNRVAVLLGTYVNTPLTIVPLLVLEVTIGVGLFGGGEIPELTLRQFRTTQGWKDAFDALTPFLGPLMVGSLLLGAVAAACAYLVCVRVIFVYRRRVAAAATGAAAVATALVAHAAEAAAEAAARAAARARAEVQAEASTAHALAKGSGSAVGGSQEGPVQGRTGSAISSSAPSTDPSKTSS